MREHVYLFYKIIEEGDLRGSYVICVYGDKTVAEGELARLKEKFPDANFFLIKHKVY